MNSLGDFDVRIEQINSVEIAFHTLNDEIVRQIREAFEYQLAEWYRRKYRIRFTKISLVYNRNHLYIGNVPTILELCREKGWNYYVEPALISKNKMSKKSLGKFVRGLNLRLTPHYYQYDAIYKVITEKNHVVLSPTSSGKSLIIAILAAFYLKFFKKKVLLVVPDKGLVQQMYFDICDYFRNSPFKIKDEIGMIHGDIPPKMRRYDKRIIITTWQSQKNTEVNFLSTFGQDFREQVGMVMYDEVHESQAKCSKEIITSMGETDFRIGLTGTLFDEEQNEGEYKNNLIEGMFGEVVSSISMREMIDNGFSADILVKRVVFDFGTFQNRMSYHEEVKFFKENNRLNELYAKMISSTTKNAIALVWSTKYAEEIIEKCRKMNPEKKIFFINQSTSSQERQRIKEFLNENENCIVFGTYFIISRGYSINNLYYAFFLESTKAKIRVIQAIGRLLRKHEGKKRGVLFDLTNKIMYKGDKGLEMGKILKHAVYRDKYYKNEEIEIKEMTIDMKEN